MTVVWADYHGLRVLWDISWVLVLSVFSMSERVQFLPWPKLPSSFGQLAGEPSSYLLRKIGLLRSPKRFNLHCLVIYGSPQYVYHQKSGLDVHRSLFSLSKRTFVLSVPGWIRRVLLGSVCLTLKVRSSLTLKQNKRRSGRGSDTGHVTNRILSPSCWHTSHLVVYFLT